MTAPRFTSRDHGRRFERRPPVGARASLWPDVLTALRPVVLAVLESGGAALPVSLDLRHDIAELPRAPFPVDGASSEAMAQAFRLQARALMDVALPARRASIAIGVLGSIDALEGLISDQLAEVTNVWRKRLGAGD
ncbi:MAG: hypothetical protein JWP92_3716 [Caulobacter sp.]|nr:hypothetical protein [Caulobacter sp.]